MECSQWNAPRNSFTDIDVLDSKEGYSVTVIIKNDVVIGTQYTQDNCGKIYWIDYQTNKIITKLGETLPDGATWTQPDEPESILLAKKETKERDWRDLMLAKVLNRIDQYEKDQSYADEYKTSSLTVEQYTSLLKDRKKLCDYPDTDGFPEVDRPKLSGIVA